MLLKIPFGTIQEPICPLCQISSPSKNHVPRSAESPAPLAWSRRTKHISMVVDGVNLTGWGRASTRSLSNFFSDFFLILPSHLLKMRNLRHISWTIAAEETVGVKPVCLFPVEKGRLSHWGQPHVTFGDVSLAALTGGSAGFGVLGPIGQVVRIVTHLDLGFHVFPQCLKSWWFASFRIPNVKFFRVLKNDYTNVVEIMSQLS